MPGRIRRTLTAMGETLQRAVRPSTGRQGYGGSITHGGLVNTGTGLGTGLDKSEGAFFAPTRFWWRSPLELLYVQSSAAKKFINIPIMDMFIRWRRWESENESAAETMAEAEERHHVRRKLSQAMRAARAYGTAVCVLMTREAPLTSPLLPERIRPGDLSAIRVFDRYDLSVGERERDVFSPDYNGPVLYNIHPTGGNSMPFQVHASRCLRFDGITSLTDSYFYNYEQDWGVSELVPAIISLVEDQSLAGAIAHMSQEASTPVLGISRLREILAGKAQSNLPTVEEIGGTINRIKSVFRLLLVDKEREDFNRIAIQFGGLADLMDKFQERLAGMADIPMTRWQGASPAGLNATGESDMKNYVMMVEANRENQLRPILPLLDEVLARDAGLGEPPEHEWQSLMEISEKDQAEVAKLKAEAVGMMIDKVVIDEDEGRTILDGDPIFGELPGEAPEPPPPEDEGLPGPGGPPEPEPKPAES